MEVLADGSKTDLEAERVWGIFSKMSDEDCIAIGFNPEFAHPKWMVIVCITEVLIF